MLITLKIQLAILATISTVYASPVEDRASRKSCDNYSTAPCKCPAGTTFGNSTTFGYIGAAAKDLYDIAANFYTTDYLGLTLVKKQGNPKTVGSIRTLNVTYNNSTYQLTEPLNVYYETRDGGFEQQFNLSTVPLTVPAAQGGGVFGGYWVTMHVQQVADHVSWMKWGVYRCVSGNPFDFTGFHEVNMAGLSETLRKKGKLVNKSSVPYSIGD
ncbi:hypothetical protein ONS95_009880 [Cadophora gregata]|uniref:uncharacterized protein n=1 Tax=Cadophora gregata TaxID=51156 RepID=UPI0026DD39CC|nr:uncharacterized protein ONS95_009880 [Cadophora gregata]KAK0121591.1 hypothetical protein ONS95_009880 [Cadophora gregata]